MKKCSKCGKIKLLTEFYKDRTKKDGLRSACKVCCKEDDKRYYKNNPEKVRERNRIWRENNPEYDKEYYKNNSEKIKEYCKKYRKNNVEKDKENNKKWVKNNPEKVKIYRRKTYIKQSKNPSYKINRAIRCGIYQSLKGNKNGEHWETLVGYTLEELMAHLEKQFEPWMNWDNHGKYEEGKLKWNIDHIKPISSFNFTLPTDKEVKECWALSNLQPLEVIENIKKGNKNL
jgi:hypothetical protein